MTIITCWTETETWKEFQFSAGKSKLPNVINCKCLSCNLVKELNVKFRRFFYVLYFRDIR